MGIELEATVVHIEYLVGVMRSDASAKILDSRVARTLSGITDNQGTENDNDPVVGPSNTSGGENMSMEAKGTTLCDTISKGSQSRPRGCRTGNPGSGDT